MNNTTYPSIRLSKEESAKYLDSEVDLIDSKKAEELIKELKKLGEKINVKFYEISYNNLENGKDTTNLEIPEN